MSSDLESYVRTDYGSHTYRMEGAQRNSPFSPRIGHDAIGALHKGKQKRLGDSRLTSARPLAAEWPVGVVLNRVSKQMVGRGPPPECDEWNAAHENLIVTRRGRDPFGAIGDKHSNGGRASALAHRADHPRATVPQLSRLIGSRAPCACARLGKLADMGLTCRPMCLPGRSWILTAQGRELAVAGRPGAGWSRTRAANYTIASSGLAALGIDTPQCQPWVNVAAL
jgi:hypothetical protein